MTETLKERLVPIKIDPDYVVDYGERALPFAPTVCALGKAVVVPQQFMSVSRSLSQLEAILEQIETIDGYLLFAGEIGGSLYLQVGIIGQENYPTGKLTDGAHGSKIVYGRRWLIEESTPTSEVIQTALLAVQKAREHELREKLSIEFDGAGHRATPFNSHQDAPLMARVKPIVTCANQDSIEQTMSKVRFDERQLILVDVELIDETLRLIRLRLEPEENSARSVGFPEFDNQDIIVCFNQTHSNVLLHAVTEQLIALSNRFIAEHFRFEGFNRFSHRLNPIAVAKFSYDTRRPLSISRSFAPYFSSMSYHVDSRKAPRFNSGKLGQYQVKQLDVHRVQLGFLPTK